MVDRGEWRAGSRRIRLDRTRVMGVVNVTPDSFSDGGRFLDVNAAVAHAKRLVAEGADVLDVGGESTRPGAEPVSAEDEARRVVPVIERLAKEVETPISVDTYKASVAEAALAAGAVIVNDVSAGTMDARIFDVAARAGAGLVLMHMRGEPRNMQANPEYADVVREVGAYLVERARAAEAAGVRRESIVIDPGIGFGKTMEHNLQIIARVDELAALGYPVLVGASRKAFIGRLTTAGDAAPPPEDRVEGTVAAHALAAAGGAALVRAHDVREAQRSLAVADAIIAHRRGN